MLRRGDRPPDACLQNAGVGHQTHAGLAGGLDHPKHRATVYVTLQRLEEKGLVATWLGDPLPERGGKARRYVRVEPDGLAAVRETRDALRSMWGGLEPMLESG
ncbi:MAG TPA: hypothetical protein VK858_06705 [Longimicrobiales bacterium]|nr:hypothetical protein [Longimicrobiales bacterium]